MKTIFLDFDGVLNNMHKRAENQLLIKRSSSMLDLEHLDLTNVSNLNDLVARTGAKVVISSSWRILDSMERLVEVLRDHDFKGEVIGVTPRLHRTPDGEVRVRGDEIQAWLDAQVEKPQSFVILDDDSDMTHLMEFLVQTDDDFGLTQGDVERAVKVLNS